MEDIKEYLYVMDFSDASISEIEITKEDKDLETSDLLDKYGFNDDECFFMFTARNQLFRQIHGYNIKRFVDFAIKENAITHFEKLYLGRIIADLNILKRCQFKNSKELGFNPRRRCAYCNNIAHYKATIFGTEEYLCNKHKEQAERDNKQNINGDWMVTDIHEINPYE